MVDLNQITDNAFWKDSVFTKIFCGMFKDFQMWFQV